MSWYKTGSITLTKNSTQVTGLNTKWLDPLNGVSAGRMLIIPSSGSIAIYEILSVQSNTQLTLATNYTGATIAGSAYSIPTSPSVSIEQFALELSSTLAYYQSQLDGWQKILTGTGDITLTAPDGQKTTISSQKELTEKVAGAVKKTDISDSVTSSSKTTVASSVALKTVNEKADNALSKTATTLQTVAGKTNFNGGLQSGSVDVLTIGNATPFASRKSQNNSIAHYKKLAEISPEKAPTIQHVSYLISGGNRSIDKFNSLDFISFGLNGTDVYLKHTIICDSGTSTNRLRVGWYYNTTTLLYELWLSFKTLRGNFGITRASGIDTMVVEYLDANFTETSDEPVKINYVDPEVSITTANSTVDSNGFYKKASPILRLYSEVPKVVEGFTQAEYGLVNNEAHGVYAKKIGIGHYEIHGSLGFAKEGWYVEQPKDANGNFFAFVEYSTDENNVITVKTSKRKFDLEACLIIGGDPMDIQADRWIDLRLEMPIIEVAEEIEGNIDSDDAIE